MRPDFKMFCAAVVLALATPVWAEDALLKVSGDVAPPPEGEVWSFDLDDLRALPTTSFTTTTIWTEGPQDFEGVSLKTLLDHVGAAQGQIVATALNDYAITIPTIDAVEDGPIIAYTRNGSEMSVRNKGPLWIVYPYDLSSMYQSEEYYSRSIWQLGRLEIEAVK